MHFTVENLQRERILNQPLDSAFHGTGAIGRIVAFAEQQSFRGRSESQSDLSFGEYLHQVFQLQFDDPLDLFLTQGLEENDIVDAVQELGTENLRRAAKAASRAFFGSFPASSKIADEPTFDVMIITVFRKSTVRPFPSVRRPSSRI